MKKKIDLLEDNISTIFLKYAVPSIAGMLGTSLYVLADTMFVGRGVGSEGLAALNISIPIMNLLTATGLLTGIGGAAAMSVSIGEKKYDKVNDIFTHGMVLAFILGLVYTIFGIVFIDKICYFLGATNETITLVKDYSKTIISASLFFVLFNSLNMFIRNDNAPRLGMIAMLSGAVLNVFLDWLFIFIFHWGMWGAAFATALSPVVSLVVLMPHFKKGNTDLKLVKKKVDNLILKRIILNGLPSFIMELSVGIVIFAFNNVLMKITGAVGVSAYSIIANISLLCSTIFVGVAEAVQPVISINYGAEKMDRVYKSLKYSLVTVAVLGVVFFIIGRLFPEFLVSLFNEGNKELLNITVQGIQIYFFSFLVMGANITMAVYFQSIEYPKFSTTISLARGMVFILLGLSILPKLFGLKGVWYTVPFAEIITFIIAILCFKKSKDYIEGISESVVS
ncbi:MATE family efflux transporter [Tissierella sp. MSJ-40]|uniref:Multidrug export protein MepA n=1 Tax=Tissierella simiarum TaxID=2841534 RepID=A0ABS6E7V7_9FIRM|nr:MATE family efflux transporter [Tissierella simiarum]MBU5439010.1 MATE family efflux transporter [Tissierella simiarum]